MMPTKWLKRTLRDPLGSLLVFRASRHVPLQVWLRLSGPQTQIICSALPVRKKKDKEYYQE
jgi:hypothetical protein